MLHILKRFHAAPLSSSFFAVSMLGLLLSFLYYHEIGASYSFAFILLSICMFIASFVSMTKANVEGSLAKDHRFNRKRR